MNRHLNPRTFLGVLALVFVVVAIWAATALSAGGSSTTDPAAPMPAASSIATAPDDCPEDGGSGGSPGGSSGSTDGSAGTSF